MNLTSKIFQLAYYKTSLHVLKLAHKYGRTPTQPTVPPAPDAEDGAAAEPVAGTQEWVMELPNLAQDEIAGNIETVERMITMLSTDAKHVDALKHYRFFKVEAGPPKKKAKLLGSGQEGQGVDSLTLRALTEA